MLEVTLRFTKSRLPIQAGFRLEHLNAGLFGPSGCGKSMLLRRLSGGWTPDEGCIMLGGDLLFDSRKRSIAYRIPEPSPWWTVRSGSIQILSGDMVSDSSETALKRLQAQREKTPGGTVQVAQRGRFRGGFAKLPKNTHGGSH